tara:strand:- start:68 stop:1510 length:1443 start_codon:yes stop_codon:yes gene_type:complete
MLVPVVLAGGVGARLWPSSRAFLPKQFIQFSQQRESLFQSTIRRLEGLEEIGDVLVVCNEDHRFLVAEQLRQLGKDHSTILLEPLSRNTAPATALAALSAQQDATDPVLLVLPADHVIINTPAFHRAITQGIELARQDMLVVFGIVPGRPETGYGYIKKGKELNLAETSETSSIFNVNKFVEKPNKATAEFYIASGNYYWNSGMFMFTASRYLEELKLYGNDIFESCHATYAQFEKGDEFQPIPEAHFSACRSDSIDYAVMERTKTAAVIALEAGWSDLGNWDAVWDLQEKDKHHNVISGDVLITETQGSYIQSESRLVAAVGVKDTVIIETVDAILVAHKDHVQSVKQIVKQLESHNREESISHRIMKRPWGSYESLASGQGYRVQHMVVNPNAALSLHMHKQRSEHWTVIKGEGLITCDDNEFKLQVNESTFIPLGSKHRLSNSGEQPVEIIEVQIGDYLGEDDKVRFEDRYGRVTID